MTVSRDLLVTWARWFVDHQAQVFYSEADNRAEWVPLPSGTLPFYSDCAGTVTACYKWAGAPDPNGLGYSPLGYTGTLIDHGTEIALKDVQPGDLVLYGPNPGIHCALVVEPGADPLTMSHGQPSEPAYVYVSVGCPEAAYVDGEPYVRYFTYALGAVSSSPAPSAPTTPEGDPMYLVHTASNEWWLVSGERKESMTPEQLVALKAEGVETKDITDAELAALVQVPEGTL